jgi:hypothetical protein
MSYLTENDVQNPIETTVVRAERGSDGWYICFRDFAKPILLADGHQQARKARDGHGDIPTQWVGKRATVYVRADRYGRHLEFDLLREQRKADVLPVYERESARPFYF